MKWWLLLLPSLAAAEVKLDDAAKTIADAAAKLDLKNAPFGETLALDSIAPLDPAKPVETKVLRENLAKLKLKILHDTATSITVEAANGARARITFDQGGGAITLTARPANPTLPGKCVAIPDARHPVTVATAGTSTLFDLKTERTHDVDGDAVPDAFVPVAKTKHDCPEDVAYRVFVVRGACGHDLGVVGPGSFQFDAGTSALEHGFRPFVLEVQKFKRGRLRTSRRRFAVQRGRYTIVDTQSRVESCERCATWTCKAP